MRRAGVVLALELQAASARLSNANLTAAAVTVVEWAVVEGYTASHRRARLRTGDSHSTVSQVTLDEQLRAASAGDGRLNLRG